MKYVPIIAVIVFVATIVTALAYWDRHACDAEGGRHMRTLYGHWECVK